MKVFQKKSNTNSIKTMNSNTPNLKTKNFEYTIKSILKEVEDKVGTETDNNFKNFKNKEKITSKIIEKYKKQIKEKEAKVNNKILATSYKEFLDLSNNNNQMTKNKSLENHLIVSDFLKANPLNSSENNFPNKLEDKHIDSHRGVAKVLNFGTINGNNLNTPENTLAPGRDKVNVIEVSQILLRKNVAVNQE